MHQEVDEGGPGGQEGLLDASPLQQPGTQLTLENKFVDSVLVPGNVLRHEDLAAGFVVDLRRKARDESRERQAARAQRPPPASVWGTEWGAVGRERQCPASQEDEVRPDG